MESAAQILKYRKFKLKNNNRYYYHPIVDNYYDKDGNELFEDNGIDNIINKAVEVVEKHIDYTGCIFLTCICICMPLLGIPILIFGIWSLVRWIAGLGLTMIIVSYIFIYIIPFIVCILYIIVRIILKIKNRSLN